VPTPVVRWLDVPPVVRQIPRMEVTFGNVDAPSKPLHFGDGVFINLGIGADPKVGGVPSFGSQ
jgi:hypothetical protein